MRKIPIPAAQQLYQQLVGFPFQDVEQQTLFYSKLTREYGWQPAYIEQVLEEYRRYLVLSRYAEHTVIPPKAVAQLWHWHVSHYPYAYWNGLCNELLGEPLYYQTLETLRQDPQQFATVYQQTLLSYKRLFSCRPPRKIWQPIGCDLATSQPTYLHSLKEEFMQKCESEDGYLVWVLVMALLLSIGVILIAIFQGFGDIESFGLGLLVFMYCWGGLVQQKPKSKSKVSSSLATLHRSRLNPNVILPSTTNVPK